MRTTLTDLLVATSLLGVFAPLVSTGCVNDDEDGMEDSGMDSTAGMTTGISGTGTDTGMMTTGTDTTGDDTGSSTCVGKADAGAPRVIVNADITVPTTWTCDNLYILAPDSHIFVRGTSLTIEPGVTVLGNANSALVIEKDATLIAEGTATQPIVMTSAAATPARGDWGGLIFLGRARTNVIEGMAEGFPVPPTYGGNDDTHNCGTLAYARIEWAGYAISPGNELNGITFYSCGNNTNVHHVQVHMGQDDGIEFFGGTMNLHHIVVTGAADDSLDIDQGFRGKLQHVFIQQDPVIGDNCYEISNNGTAFDAAPLTAPEICNATCIGSGVGGEKSKGFTFKEGTMVGIYASIFLNNTKEVGLITHTETKTVADSGGIGVRANMFYASGIPAFVTDITGWDNASWEAWVMAMANGNSIADPQILGAQWGMPNPVPGAAAQHTMPIPCADATTHIGAVDPAGPNWTSEAWINYSPF